VAVFTKKRLENIKFKGKNMRNTSLLKDEDEFNPMKIYSSSDYSKFKLLKNNRVVSQAHVEKLKSDESFSRKIHTCPIVVDARFNVIDGQHRLKAASELKIPIYYIMDEMAEPDDIRIRNVNSKQWGDADYLKHYVDSGSKSYVILKRVIDNNQTNLTCLKAVLTIMLGLDWSEVNNRFREGKLKVEKCEDDLSSFMEAYINFVKRAQETKGKNSVAPILTKFWVQALTHLFMFDRIKYEKCTNNIMITNIDLVYLTTYEKTSEFLEKIIRWRRPKAMK
jgi:hypothetical protein